MLIIKTDFHINDYFLNDLSHLINGQIKQISSWGNSIVIDTTCEFFSNLDMLFLCENKYFKIAICPLFFYNENISDEVSTLKMSFENDDNSDVRDVGNIPFDKKGFKIIKIKIYGEERIRVWSDVKKRDYFQEKVDVAVADYYFNNKIIRFESFDNRQINIFAHQQGIEINLDKSLNIENDFYLVSDLNMDEDFIDGEVWTKVQRIKCHYEIDKDGVKKYVNEQ